MDYSITLGTDIDANENDREKDPSPSKNPPLDFNYF